MQRISVGWTVVRRPSIASSPHQVVHRAHLWFRRRGSRKRSRVTSKPFLVAQPVTSAGRGCDDREFTVHGFALPQAILRLGRVHEKAPVDAIVESLPPHNGPEMSMDAQLLASRKSRGHLVHTPRQTPARDVDVGPAGHARCGRRPRQRVLPTGTAAAASAAPGLGPNALRLVLQNRAGGGANRGAQHDARHVVLQAGGAP